VFIELNDINWIKLDILTTPEGIEPLCSALSDLGYDSVSIIDSSDLDRLMEGKYGAWDYIDPELMKLNEAETSVTFYIPDDSGHSVKSDDYDKQSGISNIHEVLIQLKQSDINNTYGKLELKISSICDESWDDSWKKDYTPILIGDKLIICPTWMECDPGTRKILMIDPGQAFGTGLDETTRLCLEALECMDLIGCSVLDIGCGSGILSIAAIILGAKSALGIDIIETAVKTATENAELNRVSNNATFIHAVPDDIPTDRYNVVCANISADTIISLLPTILKFMNSETVLVLSGIIKNREQDIANALLDSGLFIIKYKEENSWVCISAKSKTSVFKHQQQ